MTTRSVPASNSLRGRHRDGLARPINLIDGDELNRRIQDGWEQWCELVEDLTATGGTLPSPQLAGRLVRFFEDSYWRAEEAHVEQIRRELGPGPVTPPRSGRNVRSTGLGI